MNSTSKERVKIFETLISSPGMADICKLNFQLSRQNILLVSKLIESGLATEKESADELLTILPKESKEELQAFVQHILEKSNLTDFYAKLRTL